MSKEELHQIKELPDLKVAWHESYKCLNEPLLEYVWEVANHFLPDYEDVSAAPAIFANRYAERNLSVEERYERSIEMKTFNGTLEEYKKRYEIMSEFAPKQMDAEEIKAYLQEKFADVIATGNKGQIMKAVMADLKGKADGKIINGIVAELMK